jgi:guanine nucleotide-binding protein subunit alpha
MPYETRIEDSLQLFESLLTSRWFLTTSFVICFTKYDLLKKKLVDSPLENQFRDYTGGNDVGHATKYITGKFEEVAKKTSKDVKA